MEILIIIMIVILVLLFLIYKKLVNFLTIIENNQSNTERNEAHQEIMYWLKAMAHDTYRLKEIQEFCQATFSVNGVSIQERNRENLIKIYSKLLEEKGGMLAKDSFLRAKFEVSKFDNEKIAEDINRGKLFSEKEHAENEFYNSSSFNEDVNKFYTVISKNGEREIGPYHLFAPIYNLFKRFHCEKEETTIRVDWEADKNYDSFIKNRAIIRNLEKLGILSKVADTTSARTRNIENQNYKLNILDLNKIGEIIYKGERNNYGHDDSFFEKRFEENDDENIFRLD